MKSLFINFQSTLFFFIDGHFYSVDIPYFVYLWVDGLLGCFHVFAVMNNIDLNVDVKIVRGNMFPILSGIHLGVEFLDHITIPC